MKRLAFVPFVLGAISLAALMLDPASGSLLQRGVLVGACLITGISAFITTLKFSAGDRLFTTWAMVGAAYFVSGLRHGTRLLGSTVMPSVTLPDGVATAMVIAQNVLIALSLLLFVLAWRATGLATPGSRAAQFGSILLGIAIAVIVGGYPLMSSLAKASTNPSMIISTLGDMLGIALIVPLAMPALAMRGGLLMHTWVYLAASEGAWLLYDIWWALQSGVAAGRTGSAVLEAIRVIAIGFALVASVAQRRALAPIVIAESWGETLEAEAAG